MNKKFEISVLRSTASALAGNVSGVYLLFNNQELVYVGEGWNCLLGVAEQTRKESQKQFTHWSCIPIESKSERTAVKRELLIQHSPRFNKV